MVLIGLLLIAAAVAAAIILVVQNDGTITIHVFNSDYHVAAYWLAIAGLAIMAVLALGWWAVRVGTSHRMRLRRERRELVRENRRLNDRAATRDETGTASHTGRTRTGTDTVSDRAQAEPIRPGDESGRTPPAGV